MANSTLDRTGERPARSSRAGTRELGPSDSSDSGADLIGPGSEALDADSEAAETLQASHSAGADVGDANLDSDSDRNGTGERATAGRDTSVESGADIAPDRIIDLGMENQQAPLEGLDLTEQAKDEAESNDSARVRGLPSPKLW